MERENRDVCREIDDPGTMPRELPKEDGELHPEGDRHSLVCMGPTRHDRRRVSIHQKGEPIPGGLNVAEDNPEGIA